LHAEHEPDRLWLKDSVPTTWKSKRGGDDRTGGRHDEEVSDDTEDQSSETTDLYSQMPPEYLYLTLVMWVGTKISPENEAVNTAPST